MDCDHQAEGEGESEGEGQSLCPDTKGQSETERKCSNSIKNMKHNTILKMR